MRRNRRQRLLDAQIRAGGKLEPVLRDKFKAVEKVLRRNQSRRLLQKDTSVDTGKFVGGKTCAPILKLLEER